MKFENKSLNLDKIIVSSSGEPQREKPSAQVHLVGFQNTGLHR
jgi:hypothetical protein